MLSDHGNLIWLISCETRVMWKDCWKDFGDIQGDDQFQVKKGRSFPWRVCRGQRWGRVSHCFHGEDAWYSLEQGALIFTLSLKGFVAQAVSAEVVRSTVRWAVGIGCSWIEKSFGNRPWADQPWHLPINPALWLICIPNPSWLWAAFLHLLFNLDPNFNWNMLALFHHLISDHCQKSWCLFSSLGRFQAEIRPSHHQDFTFRNVI